MKQANPCSKQAVDCFETSGRLFQSRQAPVSKQQPGACVKGAGHCFKEAVARLEIGGCLFQATNIDPVDFIDQNLKNQAMIFSE